MEDWRKNLEELQKQVAPAFIEWVNSAEDRVQKYRFDQAMGAVRGYKWTPQQAEKLINAIKQGIDNG